MPVQTSLFCPIKPRRNAVQFWRLSRNFANAIDDFQSPQTTRTSLFEKFLTRIGVLRLNGSRSSIGGWKERTDLIQKPNGLISG
jgi:hypothetical protein